MTKKKGIEAVIFFVLLSIFTAGIAFLSLDGFHLDFETYPYFTGDSAAMSMHIKSIQENGLSGLYFNPRIGAPDEGSHLVDATGVDFMLGLMIWLLDKIFHPGTARLYYYTLILTFAAAACAMAYLLGKLKINIWVNFGFSALFALGPYHFYRYLYHLAIGNSFTVPLAILLCLYMAGVVKEDATKDRIQYAICGLMLGLGCAYFTFFGFVIMAVALLMKWISSGSLRKALTKSWVFGVALAGFLLSRLPAVVLNLSSGKNTVAFARSAVEQEWFGLKIIQMLLPVSYSRIGFLKRITDTYNASGVEINENAMASLGMLASIGFCILCGLFFYSFFAKKSYESREKYNWALIDFLSISTLSLILAGSIGGFGEIFNMMITPQIRCYNRASVYITCFGLLIIAYLVDHVCRRRAIFAAGFTFLLLLIGMYDQVMINDSENGQVPAVELQDSYEAFFDKVQATLGEDSMVYELPFMKYPENGAIQNLADGKHFMGYLFTEGIRWSYGGIKGRDKKAKKLNKDDGMSAAFLDGLRRAGFDAVYIDMDGYAEGDTSVLDFYYSTGIDPIVSDDGKLYLWDIRE